jgi:putative ABC transport system permease protein
VGVVADQKAWKLDEEPEPEVFFDCLRFVIVKNPMIAIRTPGDPLRSAPLIRRLVAAIDPTQPAFDIQTMEQVLADSIAPRRFNLFLLAAFACAAVLLAALGVYGVIAYSVAQRTHEIGVRMALGAKHGDVVGMVVRQGMTVALFGIFAGAAAALGLTRLMGGLLYGVQPNDPATFASMAAAMTIAALAACWAPARRASLVDPVAALRSE